jgi:outer membrane protein assembly factor BamB
VSRPDLKEKGANGKTRAGAWQTRLGITADSAAIGPDGTIYVSAGGLYAVSPEGTELSSDPTNVIYGGAPSVGADGTVCVAGIFSNSVCAFNPGGVLKWRAPIYTPGTNASPTRTPAIDSKGTIYSSV